MDRIEQRVRVVLVSPGDVAKERSAAKTVVDELNRGVAANRLVLWRWETDARSGLHLQGPQGLIDDLMDITDADLVVGVFWKRFGTPTAEADSGTEHELRRAWAAWNARGRPEVMVYFCTRPYSPKTVAETTQWGRVLEFQRELPKQQLWWTYTKVRGFEALLREHLTKYLLARSPAPDAPAAAQVRTGRPSGAARRSGQPGDPVVPEAGDRGDAVAEEGKGQLRRESAPRIGDGHWDVFIAYPTGERDAADELYAALRDAGASVFLDHACLLPGDPWPAVISAAQSAARLTVVLVSSRTARAHYQTDEIARAIELYRADAAAHAIVPVYLDADADPPYGLRTVPGLWASAAGGVAGVTAQLLALVRADVPDTLAPGVVADGVQLPVAPRRSPFRPGSPLYVGDFLPAASRRALVDTIKSDIRDGTNVNLIGERRLGRTSLLNHVWGRFVADGGQVVARVNLQDGVVSAEDFYGTVLWGIGQCPLGAELLGADPVAQLDRSPRASYGELRDVLRRLREQTAAVLLVDEFERCFELPDAFALPAFYDNLRSLLGGDLHGPYLRAVVATREPLAAYFTSRQITSTLPGYLPPRRLGLLTADEAQEVLAQDSPHRLASAQREHAAQLGANHPCLLQCAGEAWYRALEAGEGSECAQAEFRRLSDQVCIGAVLDAGGNSAQ